MSIWAVYLHKLGYVYDVCYSDIFSWKCRRFYARSRQTCAM